MAVGWIKIHRKLMEDVLYFAEPFTRMQAWIDLLLLANYDTSNIFIRGNKIEVKRGQIAKSQECLAERWKWSRGKVLRFLAELENENRIVQQKSKLICLISIVNYERYQSDGTSGSTTSSTSESASNGTSEIVRNGTSEIRHNPLNINNKQEDFQKSSTSDSTTNSTSDSTTNGTTIIKNIINKEDNNLIKESIKKKAATAKRFCPPSLEDVQNYISEKGYSVDAESFIAFYQSKDWYVGKNKMKDWKAAIVTWEKRGKTERRGITRKKEINKNCNDEWGNPGKVANSGKTIKIEESW